MVPRLDRENVIATLFYSKGGKHEEEEEARLTRIEEESLGMERLELILTAQLDDYKLLPSQLTMDDHRKRR